MPHRKRRILVEKEEALAKAPAPKRASGGGGAKASFATKRDEYIAANRTDSFGAPKVGRGSYASTVGGGAGSSKDAIPYVGKAPMVNDHSRTPQGEVTLPLLDSAVLAGMDFS